METPEFIRTAYAPVENETPDERRRRLASKRAAKYRYFAKVDNERRVQSKDRQRRWRETLDDAKRHEIREQNRLRQQARRGKMTSDDKHKRNQQQRQRRAVLDEQALEELREREKLRMRNRRDKLRTGSDVSPANETTAHEPRQREPLVRLSSSPIMLGMFSPPSGGGTLPPAAALGAIRGSDDHPPPSLTSVRLHHHHHAPIEIAPLQFVLPPASSIQSHSFADRTLAPLPQVQNVLPHASTLLNAAAPPPQQQQHQQQQQLMPLAIATGPVSVANAMGSTLLNSVPQPPLPASSSVSMVHLNSPFVYAPPSSASSLGSLLNPSGMLSLPPHLSLQPNAQPQGVLPSLSQLPELLATASSGRDFFDTVSTSAHGYFPSIADFTSDFETTFRT